MAMVVWETVAIDSNKYIFLGIQNTNGKMDLVGAHEKLKVMLGQLKIFSSRAGVQTNEG